MKIKAILSVLFLSVLCSTNYSQTKGTAIKFDEFSNFPAETVSPLYDRTERFAKRFRRESLSKSAVIRYYNQRKGKYPLEGGKDWGERASNYLNYSSNIPKERIYLINGGYREYATLEFWIAAKDAEILPSTPTYNKSELVYCPEINVAGDGFRRDRNQPLKFSVVINGAATNESFPLEWSVSAGKILSGQGTNLIEVDLSETDATKFTASVIVKGLPPECDCHAYNSTQIGNYPYKIDEFSHLPYSDIAARMDSYFNLMANEPNLTGYIIVYGSRASNKKDVAQVIKTLNRIMLFRKYDPTFIKIVDGGFREDMSVEVYLLPAGTEPPKPSPTLNSDFISEPIRKTSKRRKK